MCTICKFSIKSIFVPVLIQPHTFHLDDLYFVLMRLGFGAQSEPTSVHYIWSGFKNENDGLEWSTVSGKTVIPINYYKTNYCTPQNRFSFKNKATNLIAFHIHDSFKANREICPIKVPIIVFSDILETVTASSSANCKESLRWWGTLQLLSSVIYY